MNLKIYLFLFLFSAVISARAQSNIDFYKKSTPDQRNTMEIEVYGDYHLEDFRWSIAGNSMGQNPDILSEVKWKNLKGPGMGLDIHLNIWSPIFFKGNYQRTLIKSGLVSDTDYAADNRTDPGYHADLNGNEGFIYTYSAALGYEFTLSKSSKINLYAGYVKNSQHLHLKEFREETDPAVKVLNSTYNANWTGPMIGAETKFFFTSRLSVKAILNYKQMKYKALADWNLIDAFAHPVSFKHSANGYGTEGLLQLNFRFTPVVSAFVRGNYNYENTGKGTDELFLADGRQLQSQFNGAVRHGGGFGMGISLNL